MNNVETCRFARQVGFGLAPDEATPTDALGWAQAQFDTPAPVSFLADRTGKLMDDLPAGLKLLHTQEEVAIAWWQHHETEQKTFAMSKTMSRTEWDKAWYDMVELPYFELEPWKETLLRGAMAVNGPTPVVERFWHFWSNHFTVAATNKNINTSVGPYMRMLRNRMSGSFRDMLFEAVTHPAMVLYLDNEDSVGPRSRARQEGWTKNEINENLGRELLELFTVSPAAGYTQEDVLNTTYILTGWGVHVPDKWRKVGIALGSRFDFDRHQPGTHTVMGKKYNAFVRNSGKLEDLVDDLAAHPATAQHICHKLATAFIADEPPPQSVARLVKVFQQSKGHLPTLHKAVVAEVALASAASRKYHSQETWLWTIYRVSGSALPVLPPVRGTKGERFHETLLELGQQIFRCPQPNGWSLQSRDWISKEMLDRRVRYAYEFAQRIVSPNALLRSVVARQHGLDSPLIARLETAARAFLEPNGLWAAYLTSPDVLWS